MNNALFRLEQVKIKQVLKIDHLEIPESHATCIIGPSGSGKTTLLRLLNKLNACDAGEIYYKDKPLSGMDSVLLRREAIMLSQQPAVYDGTVRDNLQIGRHFAEKQTASEEEMKETMNEVQLQVSLDQTASELSGGEAQRMALARVLLLDPEVLLLDEPTSALDDQTEEEVIKRVTEWVEQHRRTMIMVTHSAAMARTYGENLIRIENGTLKQEGEDQA